MLIAFISSDFISPFLSTTHASKNKKVQEKEKGRTDQYHDNERNNEDEHFHFANEDDDYYDPDFDSDRDENNLDDNGSDSAIPKESYDIDLGQVPDDGSRDGILSEEEQFNAEQNVEQFEMPDDQPILSKKKKIKKQNNKELGIVDMLANPSAMFESPPYDVTKLSRGGRVHISFCTS